jgi:cholesterol 25-hydroxylase
MSASAQSETHREHSVFLPRLVLGTLFFVTVFLPFLLQPLLTWFYSYLYGSPFYRFSGFETVETIVCYSVIEVLFTYKFGKNPHLRIDVRGVHQKTPQSDQNGNTIISKPKVPKMRRPSKRMGEMLIYAAPLLLMDFTMIKKFANVPLSDIRVSGNYASLPYDYGHLNSTIALHNTITTSADGGISRSFLLPTVHNFTLSSPIQLRRALPPPFPHPPTPRRITMELLTSLLIYDTLFFLFHLALHRLPVLKRIHTQHHAHSEIHPQITNHLSITERLSLVLLANFSLNIIGSHVLTRSLFVPVFVYLLVEVHSGLDLKWGYEKILPETWGSGSKVHALHHRTGQGGLAPFFGWWDALLARWDGSWEGRGERMEKGRAKVL